MTVYLASVLTPTTIYFSIGSHTDDSLFSIGSYTDIGLF